MNENHKERLSRIAAEHGTPVYVYDAEVVRAQLKTLAAFDRVRFAQKACPNVHIQRVLRSGGAWVDCVSLGELERAIAAGYQTGEESNEIVFTADVLTRDAIERLVETRVAVNAGSEDMISQLGERSAGHRIWLRINPGFGHGHSKKVNTGGESSKHGIWHENLPSALKLVEKYGLDLVGLHMHIGSGADQEHLLRVCDAMAKQVRDLGCDIRAVSGGGGLSIPYRDGDPKIDVGAYYRTWNAARRSIEQQVGHSVELEIEPGRYLVGAAGVLLAEVRATKTMGANHFTLVDAGFNDLLRPAMYGAYHGITVLPQAPQVNRSSEYRPTVVAGPLCESGDVFTQLADGEVAARNLPPAQVGDLLVFHDAGAYGASMASNYNSRPHAVEVLMDGATERRIRRRQTIAELLALEEL